MDSVNFVSTLVILLLSYLIVVVIDLIQKSIRDKRNVEVLLLSLPQHYELNEDQVLIIDRFLKIFGQPSLLDQAQKVTLINIGKIRLEVSICVNQGLHILTVNKVTTYKKRSF